MINSPENQIAWELLYRTILDCYKIATRQSSHFLPGNKAAYSHDNADEILQKAKKEVTEWVLSDPFYFYAHQLGFNPKEAVQGALELLNGDITEAELKSLEDNLKNLHKQRNAYQNKEQYNERRTGKPRDERSRESVLRSAAKRRASRRNAARTGTTADTVISAGYATNISAKHG